MQRIPVAQRPDLARAATEHGLEFHEGKGITGWDESAYYQFSSAQIEEDLDGPAEEVEGLCFQVVERAVNDETVLRRLGIPENFWDYVANSWRQGEKNLYGRMDLSYDGKGPAKLLEYNADTPTALYETAVFQWEWLEQATAQGLIPGGCDQFNDLHEAIVQTIAHLGIDGLAHFACNQDIEDDRGTLEYLEECAREAGLETSPGQRRPLHRAAMEGHRVEQRPAAPVVGNVRGPSQSTTDIFRMRFRRRRACRCLCPEAPVVTPGGEYRNNSRRQDANQQ
jgi:glutathionylspermidine synthase